MSILTIMDIQKFCNEMYYITKLEEYDKIIRKYECKNANGKIAE